MLIFLQNTSNGVYDVMNNSTGTEEMQKDEGDQSDKEEMDEEESECMHVY